MTERQRQFVRLYQRHRLQDQLDYFEARQREFEAAHLQASWISGVIMIAASAAAFASTVRSSSPVWTVLAAALPALSAAVASFQRLYAFERLAKLYADARTALGTVGPMAAAATEEELEASIQVFVARAERIFQQEQGQWGQLTADLNVGQPDSSEPTRTRTPTH